MAQSVPRRAWRQSIRQFRCSPLHRTPGWTGAVYQTNESLGRKVPPGGGRHYWQQGKWRPWEMLDLARPVGRSMKGGCYGVVRGNWQGRQDSNPRPTVLETWSPERCAARYATPSAVRQDRGCPGRNYSTPIRRSAPRFPTAQSETRRFLQVAKRAAAVYVHLPAPCRLTAGSVASGPEPALGRMAQRAKPAARGPKPPAVSQDYWVTGPPLVPSSGGPTVIPLGGRP